MRFFVYGRCMLIGALAAAILAACGGTQTGGLSPYGAQQANANRDTSSSMVLKWVPDRLTITARGTEKHAKLEFSAGYSLSYGMACAPRGDVIVARHGSRKKNGIISARFIFFDPGKGPNKCRFSAVTEGPYHYVATLHITVLEAP